MATWTIISNGTTGSGTQLVGYRIVVTLTGPPPTQITTYKFLPPKGSGDTPYGTTTSSPPSFTGMTIGTQTWNVTGSSTPPEPPPKDSTWSGTCSNPGSLFKDDPGTWAAESGGGTFGGKGKGKKSPKGKNSAKGTSKKSAKGTSKKAAKGTKSTSKKGTKSASKKGTKSTKSTKGIKGTKSAKKTRGRG